MRVHSLRTAMVLLGFATLAASQSDTARPGVRTARNLAGVAIDGVALKLQSERVAPAEMESRVACMRRLMDSTLIPEYLVMLDERFTAGELRDIDAFFSLPVSQKLNRNALYMVSGELPNVPRPERPQFTPQDMEDLRKFAQTPGGMKYRGSDLIHSENLPGPAAERVRAALRGCAGIPGANGG